MPDTVMFVVEALLIVAVPVVFELVTVSPVAERLVVEAFVVVKFVIRPLVNESPVPEIAVVDAFTKLEATVVEVATKFDAVTTPFMRALPATESFSVGVVVPMPKFPAI